MTTAEAFCRFRDYLREHEPDEPDYSPMFHVAWAELSGLLSACETIDDLRAAVLHCQRNVKPDAQKVGDRAIKIGKDMIVLQDIAAQQRVAQWN